MNMGSVEDFAMFKETLKSEFGHAMKGKKESGLLYLSESVDSNDAEGVSVWQLITKESDIERVISRGSIKIVERPPNHTDADYDVAFPLENGRGRRNRAKGGKVERFVDDEETGAPDVEERFADDDEDEAAQNGATGKADSRPQKAALDYTSDDERRAARNASRSKSDKSGKAMLE